VRFLKSGLHPPPCQVRAIRLKAQGPRSRTRYSAEVQQRARTAASLYNHQHPELAGTRVKHPVPPLVRDEEARYQPVPAVPERWASELGNESRTRPSNSNHR
jgi:hypothetical protein